jgi:GNAT superfamily N-acetyltransferase
MLKIATLDDLGSIEKMAASFIHTTGYSELAGGDDISALIQYLIADDASIIILHGEDGFLAGTVSKFPFGPYMVASEVAWWVNEDKRKSNIGTELLDAFEFWAKKIGAEMVHMVSLDDSVGKFYEKKGYALYERAYMKGL